MSETGHKQLVQEKRDFWQQHVLDKHRGSSPTLYLLPTLLLDILLFTKILTCCFISHPGGDQCDETAKKGEKINLSPFFACALPIVSGTNSGKILHIINNKCMLYLIY